MGLVSRFFMRKYFYMLQKFSTTSTTNHKVALAQKCKFNVQGVSKYSHVMLLGTRFRARNCISEPGSQDPYTL
jgi:hypothetical protein